jgi:hypothetical protein
MKKLIATAAILMLPLSNIHAAEVYKWTDAEGKVHFSATPPAKKAKTVEVKQYGSESPSSYKMTEEDKKEWGDAYKNQLLKVDDSETPLNCSTALSNANWQFETLFAQGKRNLDNGSITQAQYTQATTALQRARDEVSLSRCQSATGVERAFYECMSNDQNHLVGCGTKNKISDMTN